MQDVLIKPDRNGEFDLQISGSDFASVDGFETAVPTSFFSNARAIESRVPAARKRRGWVGNILTILTGRELGGTLWTLDQARITEDTLNFAETYARESLQWMLDDRIATNINVDVRQQDDSSIIIATKITTLDNATTKYVSLWRSTNFGKVTT